MNECRVCGMLFLGGGACPSCGSQVSIDLSSEVNTDDDMIPGLAEAAESLVDEEEPVQRQTKVLPFGMGTQAEILPSQLPFGVGSMIDKVEEVAVPNHDDDQEEIIEPEITVEEITVEEIIVEEIIKPEIIVEEIIEPEIIEEPIVEEVISQPQVIPEPEPDPTPPPVRIEAKAMVQTPKVEVIREDVPEMWRIDAEEADLESIYSQEEQVVEVIFADEFDTDEVIVQFDEFHHESNSPLLSEIENAPELHPAAALEVESDDPGLNEIINSSFNHMGQGDWTQAAQILQAASTMNINHPQILNNLGLSILQNALELDENGDTLASSQYEAAIMALRQAAKLDSTNDTILLNLSHALLVSGRVEKAHGVISVICGRTPDFLQAANLMGACLIQMGQNNAAREVLMPHSGDAIVAANIARL
ncbi:MAG TPA: tetratricopeptide repeat protein [Candidatus Poseidoniales archaeon]|nr:tetratricopeptide repeat protein [Candidatus Poseidoniales archaeon]